MCTDKCLSHKRIGDSHFFCGCPCHKEDDRAVNVVRDEGGRGAWAFFYLERLVNSGVLDRAKQRGEFVPNFEKIKTLVERKGN